MLVTTGLLVAAAPPEEAPAFTRGELVCMALARSDTVLAAEAQLDAARAADQEADAAYWYPHIELEAAVAGPVQQARGNAVKATPESQRDHITLEGAGVQVRGGIEVLYPLYTFGRLAAAREVTRHLVVAAGAAQRISQRDAARNVELAVDAILFARAMDQVLQSGEKMTKTALDFVQEQLDAGSLDYSEVDRDKLTIALADLQQRRQQVMQLRQTSLAALMALVSWDRGGPPRIAAEPFVAPSLPRVFPVEPLRLALEQPELVAARAAAAAKLELATVARRALLPTFFAIGGFRAAYTSSAEDQLSPFAWDPYNYWDGILALGTRIDLDVPLLLARSHQAQAEAAQASFESAAAERGLTARIDATAASLEHARDRAGTLATAKEAAQRVVVAETLDFTAGVGKTSDLVDAMVFYFQTNFSYLEAVFEARKAAVAYRYYLRAGEPAKSDCHLAAGASEVMPVVATAVPATVGTTPRDVLRSNIVAVQRAIQGGHDEAARKRAMSLIDFEEFARRTLARQWPGLTVKQRRDFVNAFADVIATNYVNRLKKVERLSVEIISEKKVEEGVWLMTRAEAEGSQVDTDYLFLGRGGAWRVIDIRIEGVSLTERYSRSFSRVIRDHGFDDLIRRLRSRVKMLAP